MCLFRSIWLFRALPVKWPRQAVIKTGPNQMMGGTHHHMQVSTTFPDTTSQKKHGYVNFLKSIKKKWEKRKKINKKNIQFSFWFVLRWVKLENLAIFCALTGHKYHILRSQPENGSTDLQSTSDLHEPLCTGKRRKGMAAGWVGTGRLSYWDSWMVTSRGLTWPRKMSPGH